LEKIIPLIEQECFDQIFKLQSTHHKEEVEEEEVSFVIR